MIRKVASITSAVLWLLAILYSIFVESVPQDIYEYIDNLYPEHPYEMYIAVIGLLILWVSCYFVYKNSKYALHFVGLTFLVAYFPLISHLMTVYKNKNPKLLDPELKKLAISTFLLSILLALGLIYFISDVIVNYV